MSSEIAKPLLKSGALYVWEMVRCVLLGIVISAVIFIVSYAALGSGLAMANRSVGAVVWLFFFAVLFSILYGAVGHQRGIGRVLATLTQAHGGLLFDQTLGRFIDAVDARKPGTMAALANSPKKFAAAFKVYLSEATAMPRLIKRVAMHYVSKLGARTTDGRWLPADVVSEGRFNSPAFKSWTVEQMRDRFVPSWIGFGLVLGLQVLVAGSALWFAR
jgi:hypothetical protein